MKNSRNISKCRELYRYRVINKRETKGEIKYEY